MSDSQVEEIKSKVDILSLIGERVNLKKAGKNYKGVCPFHGEKTPSFFVTPDIQIFKCFGCGKSGDIFNFLMEFEGITFKEALEILAERAGVTLQKTPYQTDKEQIRDRLHELLHFASEYYHYLLISHSVGKEALHYLKDRKISNDLIKDFKIGYSLDSWDGLQSYLVGKKGYKVSDLELAGLIIRGNRGYYDRFRGRLMFPLTTYSGKIVGFSGRVLVPDAKEAKYINSPETEIYHKSELLFGLKEGKRQIKEKDRIIIVEGEFDVISSHQIGLKETVALKGSALTKEQASLIRRLTNNVILALDADTAGQEAIKRAISVCEEFALNLRVVRITSGKDPDELSKSDPSLWRQMVDEAQSIYSFLIQNATENFDIHTGEGKKNITKAVLPELVKIENAIEREFYLKKLADTLKISTTSLEEEFTKTKRSIELANINKNPTVPSSEVPTKLTRRQKLERLLLGFMMHGQIHDLQVSHPFDENWFSEPHLKRLYQQLNHSAGLPILEVIHSLPDAARPLAESIYLAEISTETTIIEATRQAAKVIFELEEAYLKDQLVKINANLAAAIDPDTQVNLKLEKDQLAARLKEIEDGRMDQRSL